MMGDALAHPASNSLPLEIRVREGVGSTLQIIGAGGVLTQTPIASAEETIEVQVSIAGTPYVRAQLTDPTTGHVRTVTNPIYLSVNAG